MVNSIEFEELVRKRCSVATEESIEYKDLEEEFNKLHNMKLEHIELINLLQARAEEICYKKGFQDAMSMKKCSQKCSHEDII